jgi:CRISPR-associated protein Cas1
VIQQCLNTLYVQSPEAHVRLDHDTLRVTIGDEEAVRVPLHHLGGVVLFGGASMSQGGLERCAEEGREVTFLSLNGRFRFRVDGPTSGNVLLRLAQMDAHRDQARTLEIARRSVAAKIHNSRLVLLRGARDARSEEDRERLTQAVGALDGFLATATTASSVDTLRGIEGEVAAWYFSVYGRLLTVPTAEFAFAQRTRRPPRDRVNALLSFLYSILTHDCAGAVEGVGLDPQIGFLHSVRPGRLGLALDLAEEFRAGLVDRLVATLINRRQVRPDHFEVREGAGESVMLTEEGRKAVLVAYQKRKQERVAHSLLKEEVPLGLVPHLQARLLARHLRGELPRYPPFLFGRRRQGRGKRDA